MNDLQVIMAQMEQLYDIAWVVMGLQLMLGAIVLFKIFKDGDLK